MKLFRLSSATRTRIAAVFAVCALSSCDDCDPIKIVLPPPPTDVTLTFINAPPTAISPGQTGTLDVLVTRNGDFTGGITVTMGPLADNEGIVYLSVADIVLGSTETVAHLRYTATAAAPTANFNVYTASIHTDEDALGQSALKWNFQILAGGSFTATPHEGIFSIAPGASDTTTIAYNRAGLTSALTAAVTTLSGVHVTLTPASTTGNTALATITVDPNAAAGNVIVHVPVTAVGGKSAEFSVGVIVDPASFTVAATPSTLTLPPNNSQDEIITVSYGGQVGPVALTGTAPAGITVIPVNVPTQSGYAPQTANMQVSVGPSVLPGTYLVTIHATARGQLEKQATFQVLVPSGSFSLSLGTAPINVIPGSSNPDIITILRNNFLGAVTLSAVTDDPGLTVTPNPAAATTGNQVTLNVVTGGAVSVGTHLITIKGVAVGQGDTTKTLAAVVTLPAGGVPTGIVLVPSPATTALNGTQQFTAYLVDAQGNRTLPAAGWEISILSESSAVSQDLATPAYDVAQRWQTRPIRAVGVGSTVVHAAYDRISDGFTMFVVLATFTVTPNLFDQGIRATLGLQTAANGALSNYYTNFTNTGPTFSVFGLPVANQLAGDVHYIMAKASNGVGSTTSNRIAGVAVSAIVDMTMGFGQPLNSLTPTVQGTLPLAGWSNSWGLLAGFSTHWIVTGSGWSGGTGIVFPILTPGTTFKSATIQGDITP